MGNSYVNPEGRGSLWTAPQEYQTNTSTDLQFLETLYAANELYMV